MKYPSHGNEDRKTLRLPPDVHLGSVNPPNMVVGSVGTWEMTLRLSSRLKGDEIVLWLGGHRWVKTDLLAQNQDPRAPNYVSASIAGGLQLKPAPRDPPKKIHELMRVPFRIPKKGIPSGSTIRILVGDRSQGSPGFTGPVFRCGNVFLPLTARPKPETLGKKEFNWIGAFQLDFLGGTIDNLKVLAPSQVACQEPFSVTVRPQDRYGNISEHSPGGLDISIEGRKIHRESQPALNPAGAIEIGDLSFKKEGIKRIEVQDTDGRRAISNPIRVGKSDNCLFWGLIHEHTEISDGMGSLGSCYRNLRYGSRLDFGASSDHDHVYETSDEMWGMTKKAAAKYHDPGSFVTLLGYEWAKWRKNGDGDRNVYYPGDDGEMFRSETGQFDTPNKLFQALEGQECLIIPHHTAYEGNFCDWSHHDPQKERLVEIYSVWGSSEMSAERGNPLPIRNPRAYNPKWIKVSGERPSLGEQPVGFVQNALAQGWRVGFTGGGDMHKSHPGHDVRKGFPPYDYKPGITGVCAPEKTRKAIYTGLKSRCCYATTGARIILQMDLNGSPMGSELLAGECAPREINLEVHGTSEIAKVELIRNNQVIRRERRLAMDFKANWVDDEDFMDVSLPANRWSKRPFIFYYVRLQQEDSEMAWSSPVWVQKDGE